MTCALPVTGVVPIDRDDVRTVELPDVERAATTGVRGAPDLFHAAVQALHSWAEQTRGRTTRDDREVYLDCDGLPDT